MTATFFRVLKIKSHPLAEVYPSQGKMMGNKRSDRERKPKALLLLQGIILTYFHSASQGIYSRNRPICFRCQGKNRSPTRTLIPAFGGETRLSKTLPFRSCWCLFIIGKIL